MKYCDKDLKNLKKRKLFGNEAIWNNLGTPSPESLPWDTGDGRASAATRWGHLRFYSTAALSLGSIGQGPSMARRLVMGHSSPLLQETCFRKLLPEDSSSAWLKLSDLHCEEHLPTQLAILSLTVQRSEVQGVQCKESTLGVSASSFIDTPTPKLRSVSCTSNATWPSLSQGPDLTL